MKKCNSELVALRERKAAMEDEITQFLSTQDGPGVIVDGIEVSIEKKQRKERLGSKKRREELERILKDHAVDDTEAILEEMSRLGATQEKNVLKIKKKGT